MDSQNSVVKGSVLIVHRLQDGKHSYEVGHVNYKRTDEGQQFVRGEQLMQINRVDLQNITPEELARTIADGNLMLSVHRSKTEDHKAMALPAEDTLRIVSKETRLLKFSMNMVREDDLGESEEEGEDDGFEEDSCHTKCEEKETLVVTMNKTSISVVRGRGNAHQSCPGCSGNGCTFHDLVMVAESSTLTIVSRGGANYRLEKTCEASVKHVSRREYLRHQCSKPSLYLSPDPERITIYFYKSNTIDKPFKGVPVVLNFTGSDYFVRCCKEGMRVRLHMETYDKQKLLQISKNDESSLSFVFCMKSNSSRQQTFESALYPGWFIKIVDTESVEVEKVEGQQGEQLFQIIIQK